MAIRQSLSLAAVFSLLLGGPVAAAVKPASAPIPVVVTVPDDTLVSVQLATNVSSADNHVGDIFEVQVTDDVNAGGYLIITRSAKGRGHVVKIDPAGGHGHPGTIEVVIDYIFSVDGLKIKLKDSPLRQEGTKAKGGATVAGIFTYGLASNAVRGGEATLITTRTLETHVAGPVHVSSTQKATSPSSDAGFAH